MMNKLEVGLVIAKEENDLSELDKFSADFVTDLLVFPEGYLKSENLEKAQELMRYRRKWLVTSVEDRRITGELYQTGIVINSDGVIVGEHKKTSITNNEISWNVQRGDREIRGDVIKTPFGKVGLAVCFELHFPEVPRIYATHGAQIIFNPIGTGMWHEDQYRQWNAMALTRAAENGTFVLGVSHFNDEIPIAFAYAPGGECLVQARDANNIIPVTLDLDKYRPWDFSQRRPDLYGGLV